MTAIDGTGLKCLTEFCDKVISSRRNVILCGALPQPLIAMQKAGLEAHIGAENLCPNVTEALARAHSLNERG